MEDYLFINEIQNSMCGWVRVDFLRQVVARKNSTIGIKHPLRPLNYPGSIINIIAGTYMIKQLRK
jgi:hypothetical protein